MDVATQVNPGALGDVVVGLVREHHALLFPQVHHLQAHRFVDHVMGPVVVATHQDACVQPGRFLILEPRLKVFPRTVGRRVKQISEQHQRLGSACLQG